MKTNFLTLLLIYSFVLCTAQITEVKKDGNYAKIYDDKGKYTGHSIYLGSNNNISGYNAHYVVITEGNYAKIYLENGNYSGKSIYLGSSNFVKNVSNSAILVKEGHYVKYYDFNGHYTGASTYE